ncbi:hypothetical protein Tco_1465533 [Tanacetum coccineum]
MDGGHSATSQLRRHGQSYTGTDNKSNATPSRGNMQVDMQGYIAQNRQASLNYLKYTQEQADILQKIVKQAKAKQPLDNELELACKLSQVFSSNYGDQRWWPFNPSVLGLSKPMRSEEPLSPLGYFTGKVMAKCMGT